MKKPVQFYYALPLAALLFFLASPGVFSQEKQKSDWYIGFGLGSGNGGWKVDGESVTFNEWSEGLDAVRVTGDFGVGAIINPNLHLGFDMNFIRHAANGNNSSGVSVEAAMQITNYLLMATIFPAGTGFFLRGGAGASIMIGEITIGSTTYSEKTNGTAALGGLGYAFWVGQSMNLCLNFDYSYQKYKKAEGKPENSHYWNFFVSLYWF